MFFHKQYPLRVLRGHRKRAISPMTSPESSMGSQEEGISANDIPVGQCRGAKTVFSGKWHPQRVLRGHRKKAFLQMTSPENWRFLCVSHCPAGF